MEALAEDLYSVAKGLRSWSAALADGSIALYGEPKPVNAFPTWFL